MIHGNKDDEYITPPDLVLALGPFDLDPCCPPYMFWRTARRMVTNEEIEPAARPEGAGVRPDLGDGLATPWSGRVWLNPPYSDVAPWAERLAGHGRGVALVSAKSTETAWGQLLMRSCDSAMWLDRRIKFYRRDGRQTAGAFLPNVLFAMGHADTAALTALPNVTKYGGVHMWRVNRRPRK